MAKGLSPPALNDGTAEVKIMVCPLSRVQDLAVEWRATRVVSLLDPDHRFPELSGIPASRHLRLAFHDAHLAQVGITLPARKHVGELLAFLERCAPTERLLIHCRAGISRSTGAAFIVACYLHRTVSELEIAQILRETAPLARPNEVLVGLADKAMARQGRMSAAIENTGRVLPWIDVDEGDPFEFVIAEPN